MTTARADPVVTARRTHSTDLVPSGQRARSSSWFRRPTSSPSTRSSDPSALLPRQLRDCGSRWHSVRATVAACQAVIGICGTALAAARSDSTGRASSRRCLTAAGVGSTERPHRPGRDRSSPRFRRSAGTRAERGVHVPVIQHRAFAVEPWAVRETELDLDRLAQTESVFALANGHIGLRGNLDEGEPFGLPGTYLAGFYEMRPLPYAEAGYGYPEAGQTVVNVTNGKIIRLLVDDEPFDVRYGELRRHERDARPSRRRAPAQRRVGLADGARRARLLDPPGVVHAAGGRGDPLRGRAARRGRRRWSCSPSSSPTSDCPSGESDPRAAAALASPLRSELLRCPDTRALLVHSTRASGLTMAAAMDHVIDGPPDTDVSAESFEDLVARRDHGDVAPGRAACGSSSSSRTDGRASARCRRSRPGRGGAGEARHTGWDGLLSRAARLPR